jgi:hypothetical protein
MKPLGMDLDEELGITDADFEEIYDEPVQEPVQEEEDEE